MTFRIAMVAACPFPARRGTPLRIERLADALQARGNEVEVVTYHLCDEPSSTGYPVHRIRGRTVVRSLPPGPTVRKLALYDPLLARLIRRILTARPFDVIHAHHFEGVITAHWARDAASPPLVYDAHTMLHSELPSYSSGIGADLSRRFGGLLDGRLPRLADHVVTVTDDIRDRLVQREGLDPSRVTTCMNGVELDYFASAAEARPLNSGRIIYTGTLAAYQGFDLLLEAFAKALAVRSDLRLVCAASSSFAPYEKRVRELGIRHAIELEADSFAKLPGRLAAAQVAVLPRTACDGIPQKLLNYMAAGKAIVASRGSAKTIEDGRTGLVVENDDAEAFAQAILRLCDDQELAAGLGRAARAHVEAHCSWDETARLCEEVYAGLILPAASRPASGDRAPVLQSATSFGDSPSSARSRPISSR
ncbi:MAG: glycosyltransferase family 4 protein [Geminicoccaceae bacterium]|nr:glycosyltransferase family 4 protein [Geminicoccaceae bacterium]